MLYDPAAIGDYAEELYKQAKSAIVFYTLCLSLAGCSFGVCIGTMVWHMLWALVAGAVAGAAVGAYVGYTFGRRRSFQLKLRAQTALCKVVTEQNMADLLKVWSRQ